MFRPFALSLCAGVALLPLPVFASTMMPAPSPPPATLVIVGHADTHRAPDRAIIRAEIVTNDRSSDGARKKNDEISQRVSTAITSIGLSDRAVRTTNFQSTYVPRGKDTPADAKTGYVSRRDIEVTTTPDSIERVTRVLNDSGVTEIDGIATDVTQKKSAYQDTLASAVQDAQLQAQVVARAAHLRIVRVLTIDATGAPVFAPRYAMMKAMPAAADAPAAADVELSATVNVTYEVAPQ